MESHDREPTGRFYGDTYSHTLLINNPQKTSFSQSFLTSLLPPRKLWCQTDGNGLFDSWRLLSLKSYCPAKCLMGTPVSLELPLERNVEVFYASPDNMCVRMPVKKCIGLCFGYFIEVLMLIWEMAFVFHKSNQLSVSYTLSTMQNWAEPKNSGHPNCSELCDSWWLLN